MPSIFWTGRLLFSMKLMVNINNLLALITGNARDTAAMKQRMKLGQDVWQEEGIDEEPVAILLLISHEDDLVI